MATDSVVVKSGVSYKITDDTRALIEIAMVMKKYGTSMISKAMIEDKKKGMTLRVLRLKVSINSDLYRIKKDSLWPL